MNRNVKAIAALITAVGVFTAMRPATATAIDLQTLEQQGEVYVVALYSGYKSEADYLERAGRDQAAAFLRGKADGVEAGAELFPLHPMAFEINRDNKPALMAAYDETFALVGSEAADVAPERIAAIQVAYETWLFAESVEDNSEDALAARALGEKEWQLAFLGFIDWSEGARSLSALMPETPLRLSQSTW